MAEYALSIYRQFRKFPRQTVLYVGRAPLTMPEVLEGHSMTFRFGVVDIRELDGAPLLASENPEENVIAVLMRLSDQGAAVRTILKRISESEPNERRLAMRELIILAGLRQLRTIIEEERQDNADHGRRHGP